MADPISIVKFGSGLIQPKTHLKTFAYIIIALFWLFVGYGLYKAYWKKPADTTTQKAEIITNITEVKEEAALELSFIPPSIKVGSFAFKIFK